MNKTELKQAVTKIKKFLKQRDYEAINTGIELARGLNDPAVFEALLGGWSRDRKGKLEFDSGYGGETLVKTWSDKTWPYFAYALVSLIGYAPKGTKVHASIVSSKIKKLSLNEDSWTELPRGLEGFEKLTSLDLSECESILNVDGLAGCTQFTGLNLTRCHALQNVNGLANCTQLTSLDLGECYALQNVDGLANCTQLTSLDLGECYALQNVDGLANCTQLTSLNLVGCAALQNVDGLANCTQLTSLGLYGCYALRNVDGLANCTQLTILDLSGCSSLQNVDGLTNCTQLTSLDLSDCSSLQNVDGLANCTQLTWVNLNSCGALQNVDGLTEEAVLKITDLALRGSCSSLPPFVGQLVNLTSLDLTLCSSLQNVDGLANCTRLTSVGLRICDSLQNVDGLANLTQLTSLDLQSCKALQNVDGLANCTQLTSLYLRNCGALQNVDGLANCTQLPSLNLSECVSLMNVVGLASCSALIHLDLSACKCVNPKPSPVKMITREQVATYQAKVLRKAGMEIPGSIASAVAEGRRSQPGGEAKKQLVKIRKLLKQKDFAAINTGVEIARSLNNPEIFGALLGGWTVHTGSDPQPHSAYGRTSCDWPLNGALVFNKDFEGDTLTRSWSNRNRSFFVYALVNLMAYAPKGTNLDPTIKRPKVKALALNTLFWPELPRCIAEFKNLEHLDLRQWVENSAGNYDFRCSEASTTFDKSLRRTMDNLEDVSTLAPEARVLLPEPHGW